MYIFVRQDQIISQQLVQAAHAAHESGLAHRACGDPSSIVIFGVPDKEQLQGLLERFQDQLPCYPFYETYKDIGLTAFATAPIGESQRHLFKEFKLWKPVVHKPMMEMSM